MTAPALIKRTLTVNFDRAINFATQLPETVEVVVIPLSVPSDAASIANVTLVGGMQSQTIVLTNDVNPAVFQLVPSNEPGLTEPLNYRIAWRQGVVGRTFTYDFAMPDADIAFDDLFDLGNIIGGEVYLQQSDLGVPGRVARLNDQGQVVDSAGTPVAGQADVSGLQGQLNIEIVNRARADVNNRNALETELTTQIDSTLATAKQYSDSAKATLNNAILAETNARQSADTTINSQITALQTSLSGLTTTVSGQSTTLTTKADLDSGGHIPLGEIPPAAITSLVPVANTGAMLALRYPQDVQLGDIALVGSPPLAYGLSGTDPSNIDSWTALNRVTSVNGKNGDVQLTAADVGAVATSDGSVLLDQVSGLQTALDAKADESDLTALSGTVSGILSDTTIVHTVDGVIPHTLNDSSMAYVNESNEITKKDGTVLTVGGSAVESVNGHTGVVNLTYTDVGALATNGDVAMDHVTGLSTALSGKVDDSDPRLSDNRAPTAHASSHTSLGDDPLTLAQSQITGLPTLITNNGLTNSSNAVTRIGSLETRVTTIEEGGGGPGGGGGAGSMEFWEAVTPTGDFSSVVLHSPFGYNPSNPEANAQGYYIDPAGAASGEAVWAYITPNGHLELRTWNESNPADPVYALGSDLTSLSNIVATKANQSDLSSLTSTVGDKADESEVSALATAVGNKADQSALDTLTTTVGGKASQSDLTSLSNTVANKANQSDLSTTNSTVAGIQTALGSKADLVTGTVPLTQLPSFPIEKTTGLSTALGLKADLVNGTVPLTQLPSIPGTQISGWNTKADLVNGVLATNQIPALSLNTTKVVANQAAMLALTSADVQPGDICIITATADQGTYILTASDPSHLANWTAFVAPLVPVSSVNGQTGTVVLSWSDVGALAANASIPISQVANLQTTINGLATTSSLTTGLAGKTSPADVQSMLSASTEIKQKANYVATSAILSLSGQQSADGVLMSVGSIVLLTAQSSSVTNGLWTVNSGAWTRPSDFTTGSWLVKGTLVLVSTASSPGTTNNNTIWQMSAASGVVDTNANSWTKAMTAGPPLVYSSGNGVSVSNQQITAVAATGGGCQVTSFGIGLDATVAVRKATGIIPAGSTICTLTHNLNTTYVNVTIIDIASGDVRLLGWTVTGLNTVSVEFASAPATNQYRWIVMG